MNYLVLLTLILLVFSKDNPKYDYLYRSKLNNENIKLEQQEMHWFSQIVDHYDYQKEQYFKQRYWVINDYFNPKNGPVFLYICGEWECTGVPEERLWVVVLAQKLQGLILVLQHRYYGESLPFGRQSFSIQNLGLLNTQQALRDLTYFMDQMKTTRSYGISNNPWISVGGSYPGALSAWLRIKYPHLVVGALASSAVIYSKDETKDYDEQVYLSTVRNGDFCVKALNSSNYRVQDILYSSPEAAFKFKSQFAGGDKLSNEEFLFFWADSIAEIIQYGGTTEFCKLLDGKSQEQQFQIIKRNALRNQVYEYSSYWLRNQTFAYETKNFARPFYYQQCTEYGLFQTFSDRHPMRSFRLNLQFFKKWCADAYGPGIQAQVDIKNMQFGGLYDKSTNIIYSNGIEDPWRWASLQSSDNKDLLVRVIDCPNCAHCVDLYTPQFSDAPSLKKARDQQFGTISEWVNTYWINERRKGFEKILFNQM